VPRGQSELMRFRLWCSVLGPVVTVGVRVLATRGQTDMRGLVTAGRAVRLGRGRWI
jgi:hypothetical protein